MRLKIRSLATLSLSALVLGACGGGGDSEVTPPSNLPPPPPPLPAVQIGVFKDLNVAGLTFVSGLENGITDSQGRFTCETGEQISFAVGGVALGATDCATLVTPNQLATPGSSFELERANLARFLQMLDVDGDPDNGIVISSAVQGVAATWSQINFAAMDLSTELGTIIADATAADGSTHVLPTETDALSHLDDTLACAYAGAYAGRVTGSNSGAGGIVIGWQAPSFGFIPLGFEWEAYDAVNEVGVFGGGTSITITDLPIIDHTDPGLSGPIAAQFVTPDRIEGTWSGGNVSFIRIGADNGGQYRLVGRADNRTPGAELAAYLSLNLDESGSISGQAFEIFEGRTYTVTGTLTGDAVSLTTSGSGTSFSGVGTLERNPDATPREIRGTFEDGSSFSVAACRLN